jgi:hypothetical protein
MSSSNLGALVIGEPRRRGAGELKEPHGGIVDEGRGLRAGGADEVVLGVKGGEGRALRARAAEINAFSKLSP